MRKIALIIFLVCGVICLVMPLFAQEGNVAVPPAAGAAGGEEETDIVAGRVTAVDAAGSTLTVTDEAGKTYAVGATKEETSIWKGDDTIDLVEVKSGDSVELEYYKNKEGKLIAIWVDVLTKEAVPPPEVKPEAAPPAQETIPETAAPAPEPAPAQ